MAAAHPSLEDKGAGADRGIGGAGLAGMSVPSKMCLGRIGDSRAAARLEEIGLCRIGEGDLYLGGWRTP